ncbi:hypothetical protein V8F20_012870 [Naviculisporaceae sp. PSN 640]
MPAGIEPGLYHVIFDTSGTPNISALALDDDRASSRGAPQHVLVGDSRSIMALNPRSQSANFSAQDSHGSRSPVPFPSEEDYNSCTETMVNALNQGMEISGNSILYVHRGEVFLALCNYQSSVQGAAGWEVNDFNSLMDRTYGKWKGAWWWRSGPNRTFWRDFVGTAICTNM